MVDHFPCSCACSLQRALAYPAIKRLIIRSLPLLSYVLSLQRAIRTRSMRSSGIPVDDCWPHARTTRRPRFGHPTRTRCFTIFGITLGRSTRSSRKDRLPDFCSFLSSAWQIHYIHPSDKLPLLADGLPLDRDRATPTYNCF